MGSGLDMGQIEGSNLRLAHLNNIIERKVQGQTPGSKLIHEGQ